MAGATLCFCFGSMFLFFLKDIMIEKSPPQIDEKLCKEKYTVFGQNRGFSLVTIYLGNVLGFPPS